VNESSFRNSTRARDGEPSATDLSPQFVMPEFHELPELHRAAFAQMLLCHPGAGSMARAYLDNCGKPPEAAAAELMAYLLVARWTVSDNAYGNA
jgi:hypothetical protein